MNRMHRAKYVIPVLFALAAILGITGWWLYRAAQPIELALYFHPFVGPEPLVLNELRYPNPGGEGRFKVRDFQFFLSNIRLTGGTGVYTEPDSYHLVRFDGAEPAFGIVLHDVPRAFEIADRVHVQVDGRRVAVVDPHRASVADALAIMRGDLKVDIEDQALGPTS